jgi:parallel beta-helix repeat protein
MQFRHAFPSAGALALALLAGPAAAATLTVDPVNGPYTTIQSAVDAAAPGDTILIKPNPNPKGYTENIVVNTANLTLVGDTVAAKANVNTQSCPTVALDGCETAASPTNCSADILVVNAPNVTLRKVSFRHGRVNFELGADGGAVRESCGIGYDAQIQTRNGAVNDLTLDRNVFQGGNSENVRLTGDRIQFTNNLLLTTDNGIDVTGNDARVTGNTVRANNDDSIEVNGDRAVLENNAIIGGQGDGIRVSGDQPTIRNNQIEGQSDDGIWVSCNSCTGGLIANNRLVQASDDDDEGIYVSSANNFTIENNTISETAQDGIDFSGTNSIIRNNTITRSGSEGENEPCLSVKGGGNNQVRNNRLNWCSYWAIEQGGGDGNVYDGNTILGAGSAGIRLSWGDGTVVNANTVTGGAGEGIANIDATNSVITGNTVTGNRTDVCNNRPDGSATGSIATFSGNTSATGGTSTPCVVAQ